MSATCVLMAKKKMSASHALMQRRGGHQHEMETSYKGIAVRMLPKIRLVHSVAGAEAAMLYAS